MASEAVLEASLFPQPPWQLVKDALQRNLVISERLCLLTQDNLESMKRGKSPLVTLGPYAGEIAEADHILPIAKFPQFAKQFSNLELMPKSLNRTKGDEVGQRQIDHLGGSGDPAQIKDGWPEGIAALAQCPKAFMKVSALVEQVQCAESEAPRDVAYYLPVLDHLWKEFGEDRLIYGSNCPVSDRGAPYAVVYELVREDFAGKGKTALEKYFWKNALAAYGVV